MNNKTMTKLSIQLAMLEKQALENNTSFEMEVYKAVLDYYVTSLPLSPINWSMPEFDKGGFAYRGVERNQKFSALFICRSSDILVRLGEMLIDLYVPPLFHDNKNPINKISKSVLHRSCNPFSSIPTTMLNNKHSMLSHMYITRGSVDSPIREMTVSVNADIGAPLDIMFIEKSIGYDSVNSVAVKLVKQFDGTHIPLEFIPMMYMGSVDYEKFREKKR